MNAINMQLQGEKLFGKFFDQNDIVLQVQYVRTQCNDIHVNHCSSIIHECRMKTYSSRKSVWFLFVFVAQLCMEITDTVCY